MNNSFWSQGRSIDWVKPLPLRKSKQVHNCRCSSLHLHRLQKHLYRLNLLRLSLQSHLGVKMMKTLIHGCFLWIFIFKWNSIFPQPRGQLGQTWTLKQMLLYGSGLRTLTFMPWPGQSSKCTYRTNLGQLIIHSRQGINWYAAPKWVQ